MWFDAKAKLAEIVADTPAPHLITVSQLSRESQTPVAENHILGPKVASIVIAGSHAIEADEQSMGGRVVTWAGGVVSLDSWWQLSEWERKGPNGLIWCGISKQWRTASGR